MLPTLLACVVIGIADGDTLTVRCAEPTPVTAKIRLADVDAPERGQPWATRSRQSLAALCFRQPAEVRPVSKDRYERVVARVRCDGEDASVHQVRSGMAWAYVRYARDPTIGRLEREARADARGLWADPGQPTPPWDWRRTRAATVSHRLDAHDSGSFLPASSR